MGGDTIFDADIAATYDTDHGRTDPAVIAATVGTLSQLAAEGPALEFAIGTGRIALPLRATGVPVSGIEISQAMVDQMRAKPDGNAIDVFIGDMCTAQVPGAFSLVFLVFNTIDNLTSQSAQLACFENAARHLAPGGRFVIETQVPPLTRLSPGETRLAFARSDRHWGIDEFDLTTQSYTSHHLWMTENGSKRLSVPFRYVWPSELDLMARIAGMRLEHRWADWSQRSFTAEAGFHVSVWRKD